MSERGGHSDKVGNRYEAIWIAKQLLLVLQGQLKSVQVEALGDAEVGVDVWLTDTSGRLQAYQCKSANADSFNWPMQTLASRGVLRKLRFQLDRAGTDSFTFVSGVPATTLEELSSRARDNPGDASAWLEHQVRVNKRYETDFLRFCQDLKLDPDTPDGLESAFKLLARTDSALFRDDEATRRDLRREISHYFKGSPEKALAKLRVIAVDNLRRVMHADDITAEMLSAGFRARLLPGDDRAAPAVERLWQTFRNSIRPDLLGGALIRRAQAQEVVALLDDGARTIAVHGEAGYGKSCLLYEVCEKLRASGVPVLAIRLDRQTLQQDLEAYGQGLGLPGAPHFTLASLAAGRRAVLVVDQLDAVQWTGSSAASSVAAFERLCREALDHDELSVVIACRSFDLDHDDLLRGWSRSQKPHKVTLSELPEDTVREVIEEAGTNWNQLLNDQRRVLQSPQALSLWLELQTRDFKSMSDLMRAYWRKRWKQLAEMGAGAEARQLVDLVHSYIERTGEIGMPSHAADPYQQAAGALKSLGVIVDDGSVVRFRHQSFSDFLTASSVLEQATRDKSAVRDLIPQVSEQTYRFRPKLRYLLDLLRDGPATEYRRTLNHLLHGPGIRFHLRQLTMAWLGERPEPNDLEQQVVDEAYASDERRPHIINLVYSGRVAWTRRLFARGDLRKALHCDLPEAINTALWLMWGVRESCGDEIAAVLETGNLDDPKWQSYASYALPFQPESDTRRLFEVRLQLARRCVSSQDHIWTKLCRADPQRAIQLLAAYADGLLAHMEGSTPQPIGVAKLVRTEPLAIAKAGRATPDTRTMLGERLQRLCDVADESPRSGKVGEAIRQTRKALLLALTGAATRCSSEAINESLQAQAMRHPPLYGRVLMSASPAVADAVLGWMIEDVSRLRSLSRRHTSHAWSGACQLFQRFASHASDEAYARLENKLLAYREQGEFDSIRRRHSLERGRDLSRPNAFGLPRYFMLRSLPADRISGRARIELEMLERKFTGSHHVAYPRHHHRGGWVRSPLSQDIARRLPDHRWLEIVTSDKTTGQRWDDSPEGFVIASGVEEFAAELGRVAQIEPDRFCRLALQFPQEANAYLGSVLSAVSSKRPPDGLDEGERQAWKPATADSVSALLVHLDEHWHPDHAVSFARTIRAYADVPLPPRVINRLKSLASHPNPEPDSMPVESSGDQEDRRAQDLHSSSTNCARGCAAEAVAALVRAQPELTDELAETIQKLALDAHPAVRVAAISIAGALTEQSARRGIDLFLDVVADAEGQVRITHPSREMIAWAYSRDPARIGALVSTMCESDDSAVARAGAEQATGARIVHGAESSAFKACMSGSKDQRLGVAKAASDLFHYPDLIPECVPILERMLSDEDKDVRQAARGCFRGQTWLEEESAAEFARRNGYSAAVQDNPESVIFALHKCSGGLIRHADLILAACSAYQGRLAEKSRSIQNAESAGAHWLGPVVFRLHEEASRAGDGPLVQRCLDAIDLLLENRVGIGRDFAAVIDA